MTVAAPKPPFASQFDAALAAYVEKRDHSASLPLYTPGEDEAVEEWCAARDVLLEGHRSASTDQLSIKLAVVRETNGGVLSDMLEKHRQAIMEDAFALLGLQEDAS